MEQGVLSLNIRWLSVPEEACHVFRIALSWIDEAMYLNSAAASCWRFSILQRFGTPAALTSEALLYEQEGIVVSYDKQACCTDHYWLIP